MDHEVIVIGAGVGGIYQIKRLTDLGINATVLEAGGDLGGTWYFNRYPGARFDSESYTYGYSFSKEVLDEWHWKEMFSGQPENLRYLNHVAEKFDLRQYMQFNCRVQAMHFDEANNLWCLTMDDRRTLTARYVVTTVGLLSIPTPPRIEGMESFEGPSFHTFDWPHEPVDLTGKRVGIIGTGATAIQVIGEIADKVGSLTVFQRRPNWTAPLNNSEISDEQMADIRARYDEIFATCARTPGGFEHEPDRRGFYEVSREERVALWDRLYDEPGFGIWLQNFREIFMDEDANAEFSEYIAQRIRGRVNDPVVAEKLIPTDHGFGIQRVPMETNYIEAFNRDNVELVDISETPLDRVTPTGLKTSDREFEFDVIVYATGFDAITGAYDRMDIRGVGGVKLSDQWEHGPSTFLGVLIHGFPNLMMPTGPQS
ncbi:MAG: NAD(P)/FAD-dependent oxidoreductase, partial [Chromatiales bacterium]|nr:NAD(P)/FAD-dependent oxidoreductase [Chromatiales bacterium]